MTCLKTRGVCIVMTLVWMSFGSRVAFGQLLVSDRATNEILEYGLDGTFQKQLVGPANSLSASDLSGPSAMAFGNGNDLFVASQDTGEVLRFNRQTGQSLGTFASNIYGPGGLLFDASDNVLFVSEFGNFDGEKIDLFNTAPTVPGKYFGEPLGSITVGSTGYGLAGMAMGPGGSLYASSFSDGRVLRVGDPTGSSPTVATFASNPGNFSGANSIVFDNAGNMDVVGLMTSSVYQFSSTGLPIGELVKSSDGGLTFPCSMLTAPNGNLLISSMGNGVEPGYIGEYDMMTGAAIPTFSTSGGDLVEPTAMLIMPAPEPSTLALAVVGGLACLAWAARGRVTVRRTPSEA